MTYGPSLAEPPGAQSKKSKQVPIPFPFQNVWVFGGIVHRVPRGVLRKDVRMVSVEQLCALDRTCDEGTPREVPMQSYEDRVVNASPDDTHAVGRAPHDVLANRREAVRRAVRGHLKRTSPQARMHAFVSHCPLRARPPVSRGAAPLWIPLKSLGHAPGSSGQRSCPWCDAGFA